MSAIRKNEIETMNGKISKNQLARCSLYPNMRLHAMAINIISAQAEIGMRFRQAACVSALRVQYIVHPRNDERYNGCRLCCRNTYDC